MCVCAWHRRGQQVTCSFTLHFHMSPLRQSASPSDSTLPGPYSTGVSCAQGHDQACIFDVSVVGLNSDSKLAQQALLPPNCLSSRPTASRPQCRNSYRLPRSSWSEVCLNKQKDSWKLGNEQQIVSDKYYSLRKKKGLPLSEEIGREEMNVMLSALVPWLKDEDPFPKDLPLQLLVACSFFFSVWENTP